MKISDLDKEEYKNIVVYTRQDNHNFNLPVYIRKVSNDLSPLHRHEMIQINYVTKGRLFHVINDSQYELVKGDIFIIPPYIPHQLLSVAHHEFEIMELEVAIDFVLGNDTGSYQDLEANSSFVDFSYIEPFLVSECNVAPRLNLTGKKQIIIEDLLNEIYAEYTDKTDSYLLALKADLLKLLVLLGRYFRQDVEQQSDIIELYNHHRDALMKAIQYIDLHYSESITIEDISHIAMLSQSYFSFLFKAVTNKTFVEYLNFQRIQHAMELLKQTDQLVVDVCFESGFKNVNHFNRTFKNMVGISPTQYRKANRRVKTKD